MGYEIPEIHTRYWQDTMPVPEIVLQDKFLDNEAEKEKDKKKREIEKEEKNESKEAGFEERGQDTHFLSTFFISLSLFLVSSSFLLLLSFFLYEEKERERERFFSNPKLTLLCYS